MIVLLQTYAALSFVHRASCTSVQSMPLKHHLHSVLSTLGFTAAIYGVEDTWTVPGVAMCA